ncbi:Hypothetical protein CINCED_3A015696 [Cinara cedri]|uniref:Uncharacterized protein n=2 Tax=Cinara cedri TaxID=506608 RepID=A0A5E4MBW5_9HEMI|nr:Hypothetical protein CINCED_3A015696 [Cinara cedri]
MLLLIITITNMNLGYFVFCALIALLVPFSTVPFNEDFDVANDGQGRIYGFAICKGRGGGGRGDGHGLGYGGGSTGGPYGGSGSERSPGGSA